MKANSLPGSAATTCDRLSQVRSGVSFRPVNQAPTSGPAPASHQQALHTGLHSPMRVTSETMAYSSPGEQTIVIDAEKLRLGVCMTLSIVDAGGIA
jgi:hypothetical protein